MFTVSQTNSKNLFTADCDWHVEHTFRGDYSVDMTAIISILPPCDM